jgi:hypothetical protein
MEKIETQNVDKNVLNVLTENIEILIKLILIMQNDIEELQENDINCYDDINICEDRLNNIDILIDNLQQRINTIEEQ